MSTRQIAIAIQGMFCPKCAGDIERALTQLDGVVAAQVNYATERATVVFDSARVPAMAMVSAVRGEGFSVPLERVVLNVDDLLFASSARTVERVLSRLDGVAQVEADLSAQRVVLDVFSEHVAHADYERAIAKLGLYVVERPAPNAAREFAARTIVVAGLAVLSLWSAGAHAGFFEAGVLHAPLVVMAISVLIAYGVGWRFYRQAYDACFQGELDASVLLALVVSASLFSGLLLALVSPSTWLTGSGFVLATLLTAGWFLARSTTVWVLPRFHHAALGSIPAAQTQLGVISDGTRR